MPTSTSAHQPHLLRPINEHQLRYLKLISTPNTIHMVEFTPRLHNRFRICVALSTTCGAAAGSRPLRRGKGVSAMIRRPSWLAVPVGDRRGHLARIPGGLGLCDHLARDRGRTAGATPASGRSPPPTLVAFPQGCRGKQAVEAHRRLSAIRRTSRRRLAMSAEPAGAEVAV